MTHIPPQANDYSEPEVFKALLAMFKANEISPMRKRILQILIAHDGEQCSDISRYLGWNRNSANLHVGGFFAALQKHLPRPLALVGGCAETAYVNSCMVEVAADDPGPYHWKLQEGPKAAIARILAIV